MRIDNIPPNLASLDRRCAGIHVVGLLPGPDETKLRHLTAYLKLITDELAKLHTDGVLIKTARYPEGKSQLHYFRTNEVQKQTDGEDRKELTWND